MNKKRADSSIDARPTLVVFCRRPAAGVGKRRIAATLGDSRTHELAELLLGATLEDARAWPGPVVIAPADAADAGWAATLLPGRADVIPQPAGNLGERIRFVDAAARALGHACLVFIGSDAPTLTPDYYARARARLSTSDVVIGPAADGGVTLMAAVNPWPDLAGLPWSTARLGESLHRACLAGGMSVTRLEPQYDVDETADIERLRHDLALDQRPARRALLRWLLRRVPRVSVVIPVLDDHEALSSLLTRIRAMPLRPFEILVVDAGRQPACVSLCERYQCIHVPARPGRGHQLHTGALRATGDALWFLHADAQPVPDALDHIGEQLSSGAVGGYFRFSFAGSPGWHKWALSALINLRCRFGVPYGDQGIFADRVAYLRTGGFADLPLFEEVGVVRALRKAGRFRPVTAPIAVSPRRWERDGWLRRTLHNRWLALGYALGVAPARLARSYARRETKESARC